MAQRHINKSSCFDPMIVEDILKIEFKIYIDIDACKLNILYQLHLSAIINMRHIHDARSLIVYNLPALPLLLARLNQSGHCIAFYRLQHNCKAIFMSDFSEAFASSIQFGDSLGHI